MGSLGSYSTSGRVSGWIPSEVSTDGVFHGRHMGRQNIACHEMRVAKRRLGTAYRDSVYAKKSRPAVAGRLRLDGTTRRAPRRRERPDGGAEADDGPTSRGHTNSKLWPISREQFFNFQLSKLKKELPSSTTEHPQCSHMLDRTFENRLTQLRNFVSRRFFVRLVSSDKQVVTLNKNV